MGITILEGDFKASHRVSFVQGGMNYYENFHSSFLPQETFCPVEKIEFLGQNITEKSGFSPLWGIVGMEAIGPIGLFLGAQRGGTDSFVTFKCTLQDGRYFIGSTSGKEYQKILSFVEQPPMTDTEKHYVNLVLSAIIGAFIISIILMYLH